MRLPRTLLRLLVIGFALPAALMFVPTGVARADDCSTPADCSNTAWTVGGAAAAAAAVVAAAAAAGWLNLPEEAPGAPRLSRECFIDLQILAGPVRATISQLADLSVALMGASRMWLDAQNRAAAARYGAAQLAGGQLTFDIVSYSSTSSSGLGEMATGAGWRVTKPAADAANRLGNAAAELPLRGPGAQYGDLAARHAADYADEAARLGGLPTAVATGAGVVNVAAEAYGQYTYQNREDALRGAGQLQAQAEIAALEAQRWKAYMDEVKGRIDALRPTLQAQVEAYNARAQACNAVQLSGSFDALTHEMMGAASRQLPSPTPAVAPASVLDRGPQPLSERDRPQVNCDPGSYASQMQQYRDDLRQWNELAARYNEWRQRAADLDVTFEAAQSERARIEEVLADQLLPYRAAGLISGTTAALAIMPWFSPLGQLIFGGISLFSGMAETYLSPSAWQTVLAGVLRERINWLLTRVQYNTGEQTRLRPSLETLEETLRVRRSALRASFRECKGAGKGWDPPPELPNFLQLWEKRTGQVRSLQEVGTWR